MDFETEKRRIAISDMGGRMERANRKPGIFERIRSMDLTSGNLFWKLGLFALPMALATILQLLYTTVDLVTVHLWGGGENSASAISGNGALINLVVVMFSGLAIGANVAIGNAIGAKDLEHAEKVVHTSLLFALFSGIAVAVFGFFMTPILLDLIQIEPAYRDEAVSYMQIYFVGLPLLMLYNYASQIHRAMGDSSTPFLALLFAGCVNLLADFLFVYFLRANVRGVAWATVLSEGVSALALLLSLGLRKHALLRLRPKELRIDRQTLGEIVKLGLPAGFQGFFFALPNTFIQSALYVIGAGNVALQNGAIAANNINNYNYAFIEAISSSTMAIIAQNYGAKKENNVRKALWYGLAWGTIYCALYSLVIFVGYRPLLSLFVDGDNEVAIEAGKTRLWLIGFTYVLDMAMDVAGGAMKGIRRPLAPAIVTGVCCTLFRIAAIQGVILRVEAFQNVLWLYSVYPISWVLACAANFTLLPILFKKAFPRAKEA